MKHRIIVNVTTEKPGWFGFKHKKTELREITVDGPTYRKMKRSKEYVADAEDFEEELEYLMFEEEMSDISEDW